MKKLEMDSSKVRDDISDVGLRVGRNAIIMKKLDNIEICDIISVDVITLD